MSRASAPALVPRVSDALMPAAGDPLIVLFGPGASDKFITIDYRELSLEQALWRTLRDAGYQRIVFMSASSPAYFLDAGSRTFIKRQLDRAARHGRGPGRGRADAADSAVKRAHTGTAASPGDSLATPVAWAPQIAGVPTGASEAIREEPGHRLVLDADVMRLLNVCRGIRDMPTAVVIIRAGEFLRFNGMERDLAEWFAQWPQAGTAVDNVCVLVFTERSVSRTAEFIKSLGYVNVLAEYLDRQRARPAGEIAKPDTAEIERIVHLVRLSEGLRVADWRELDRIVAALAAQPDVPAYLWSRRLRRLARSGIPLSEQEVRAQNWVESLPSGQSAWDRLTQLTGLDQVKDHIDRLRWRAEAEARRRREGLLREPGSLHMVFTGGPGTGKTTVARLIGELYREIGILRRGHVYAPEASELIGMYVGHTAVQTNRAVDEALDGVLFIDEAYRLSEAPGGFGQEAIDTLITRMDNERDRLVVIAAGYQDKMAAFVRSNPGLSRRFPRGNVIAFPDYEPEALFTILLGMLRDRRLTWVPELEPLLQRIINGLYAERDERFGNAGEMRNLAQELETNWARRVRADITKPVTPDDLPDGYRRFA